MTASWSSIVTDAFDAALRGAQTPAAIRSALPRLLQRRLHEAGYAVHDPKRCGRLPDGSGLGREMTKEEQDAVGLG